MKVALFPLTLAAVSGCALGRGSALIDNTLTLALQKCDDTSDWTLHGLWPNWGNPNGCPGPDFDESKVQDLLPTMETEWLSCPGHHSSNEDFWSHEWSKHGTCSGLDEHDFFQKALEVYSTYKSSCKGSDDTCEICLEKGSYTPCNTATSRLR